MNYLRENAVMTFTKWKIRKINYVSTYVFHLVHQLDFCVEAMFDYPDQTARVLNVASLKSTVNLLAL
jgi:hypothetical protein